MFVVKPLPQKLKRKKKKDFPIFFSHVHCLKAAQCVMFACLAVLETPAVVARPSARAGLAAMRSRPWGATVPRREVPGLCGLCRRGAHGQLSLPV